MASKFVRAFTQKETRNKILFTLLIIVLYRITTVIPCPGVPFHDLANGLAGDSNALMMMLDLYSGGALSKLSLTSLGIMPYITASIIFQLMTVVSPKIAAWKKEGGEGRKRITKWTRFLTIVLATINAIGYDVMFQTQYGITYSSAVPAIVSNFLVVFTLVIGAIILMYMAEVLTHHGIGNGMSVIIFTSVVSSVPSAVVQSVQTSGGAMSGLVLTGIAAVLVLVVLPLVVYVERAQRRVTIKSTKAGANSQYARHAETNYIPVPIDVAGVYAIIFSSSLIMLPVYAAAFFPDVTWLQMLSANLTSGWLNWIITFFLVIGFAFFMSGVNFDSENIADNLKKQGSYVPGVRPGEATAKYFEYIVKHVTLFGGIFIACLAVGSSMIFYFTNNALLQAFGGTSILIMISVSIQMMSSIEQNLRASDPEAVLRRLGR